MLYVIELYIIYLYGFVGWKVIEFEGKIIGYSGIEWPKLLKSQVHGKQTIS